MHTPAPADVTGLPSQPAGPLRLSPAALRALGALALSTPGVLVDFDVDGEGDAYASVSRRRGRDVALVIAGQNGRTLVMDHRGAPLAALGDDEAGIAWALRCEVECGGSSWDV